MLVVEKSSDRMLQRASLSLKKSRVCLKTGDIATGEEWFI
jgi:hypothetical protein